MLDKSVRVWYNKGTVKRGSDTMKTREQMMADVMHRYGLEAPISLWFCGLRNLFIMRIAYAKLMKKF